MQKKVVYIASCTQTSAPLVVIYLTLHLESLKNKLFHQIKLMNKIKLCLKVLKTAFKKSSMKAKKLQKQK